MAKLKESEIKVKLELHLKWRRGEEGGERANLSGANLSGADLSGADLSGTNLWVTQWPLWCGTKHVKIDAKIAKQLAAHYCAVECDDPEYQETRKAIIKFALKSHVAKELELQE